MALVKTPAAAPLTRFTLAASAVSTPTRAALVVVSVAVVVLSYTLLAAVMPVTVSGSAVMFAVGVGWVSV